MAHPWAIIGVFIVRHRAGSIRPNVSATKAFSPTRQRVVSRRSSGARKLGQRLTRGWWKVAALIAYHAAKPVTRCARSLHFPNVSYAQPSVSCECKPRGSIPGELMPGDWRPRPTAHGLKSSGKPVRKCEIRMTEGARSARTRGRYWAKMIWTARAEDRRAERVRTACNTSPPMIYTSG